MAGLLARIEERAGRYLATPGGNAVKSFTMPPFWATDGARVALAATASTWTPGTETVADDFESYVSGLYKANGPIFAVIGARARVFSQARFQFQQMRSGRPSDLFNDTALRILETPWEHGSTAALLSMMEVDASLAGNFFATAVDGRGRIGRAALASDDAWIVRLRPDWCTLIVRAPVTGNPFMPDARVVALRYRSPAGLDAADATNELLLTRADFVHYAPVPDPVARWRGMSWITPIVREAQADAAYTTHKLAFLQNGATPNLVVKLDPDTEEDEFTAFVDQFRADYEGAPNAYKTLFLGGGADVTPLTLDFQQLDMKAGQSHIETRIAMAGGVHPVIAGLSDGLQGSSLNDGNFKAARRLMVDSTIRDLWAKACPPLEGFARPPRDGTRLWYDARDIPFLREDAKDEAQTFLVQAQAARHLADGGWDPDAAIKAAKNADIAIMSGKHNGLLSVQLHDPNERPAETPPATPPNGQTPPGETENANQTGARTR